MGRKRIVMPRGQVKGLAEEFNADRVTIYRYLRFEMPEKYVAESVRKRALELGGRIIEEHDVTEEGGQQ